MRAISWKKVCTMNKIVYSGISWRILQLPLAAALFLVLISYMLYDELSAMALSFMSNTLIFMTLAAAFMLRLDYGSGMIRTTVLPVTRMERFLSMIISVVMLAAVLVTVCGITGAVIFMVLGKTLYDTDPFTVLSFIADIFQTDNMIMYMFLASMIFPWLTSVVTARQHRRKIYAALIMMVIVYLIILISATERNEESLMTVLFVYEMLAAVVSLVLAYNNIKHIQYFDNKDYE